MSSVRNDFNPEAKITYMSTVPFNNDFWSYSLTWSQPAGNYIGTLSAVSGATSGTCPAKRFLHETGKKLFPSANPGIKTMLVGVYDPVSFLNGYIDPNSEVFLRMNNDRAANIDTLNPADNEANLRSIHGEFALRPGVDSIDYGQPVYTRGNVVALGSATITGDIDSLTGDITAEAGAVTAQTNVTAVTGNVVAGVNVVAGENVIASQQIVSIAQTYNLTSQTVDQVINTTTYPSQNIIMNWTHTGALSGCTIGFNAVGLVGFIKNVFIYNAGDNILTFDGVAGTNAKYFSGFGTPSIGIGSTLYLRFISNGASWVCVSSAAYT